MLKKVSKKTTQAQGGRFAIIASEYNARYVDSMVKAARAVLKEGGADKIQVFRVPGAYEIPIVAARLAHVEPEFSALICLGVIIQGETEHARLIGESITQALMDIQVHFEVPVIHEVLLLANEEQACVRCLGKDHNRGTEAAQCALRMAALMDAITGGFSSQVPF